MQIDIVSVRGAANEVEVVIRTQQPTSIGPVSWSSGNRESCTSAQALPVGHYPQPKVFEALPPRFETPGEDVVFVELGAGPEIASPDLFLDFAVETQAQHGCLRLALTPPRNETLWRADRRPWTVSFGVRIEAPFSRLEGTGTRLTTEMRVMHNLGPVGAFFGFTLGGAGCRGADCPPIEFSSDENDDTETSGLFFLYGAQAGVERRLALGRWSLGLTLGGSITGFHLGTPADYLGEKNGGLAGPFASLSLFGPSGGAIPGFVPIARRRSSGPELFVHRQTAFGRGPMQSAWVAGLGWRFEGTQ